ncbi:MAG: DUF4330 domain-containing protein [Defluviitaleaceae bacterium]|nr:DUF4330 domain-containing protein [Defluviitaleaceae bacterium]
MRKYRLFGIINPIDVLLLIAVVALVWGAYLLARPQAVAADGGRLIRYTFELGERPAGFYQSIEPGAPAYYGNQNWWIGTVVGAYSRPFMADAPDEAAGIIRRVPVAGLEFTYIVIEAWADISDSATLIGDFWVAVNRQVPVRSRDFAGIGFITGLELVEGNND